MPSARQRTRAAAAGELGQLRIAYSWSTRFETLPALGRAFRTRHADDELLAEEMWNARMTATFGPRVIRLLHRWLYPEHRAKETSLDDRA